MMLRRNTLWLSTISIAAVAQCAHAQEVTQTAANELPPVVVEGATLAVNPPAPTKKPKPKADDVDDQPSTAKKESAKAKKSSGDEQNQAVESSDTGASGSAEGSRSPSAGIPIDEIGSAVTVVTSEQLKAQQIRNAGDALRSLPGVSVSRSGGSGNLTQVRIRGAEANHTLVIIDGVEANDTTNGEFDFADLAAEDMERIEVIRGAQSGLYGSGAIGGVINIVTKGGRGPLTFSGRVEGGSFGTHDEAARVSAGTDLGYFSIGYNRRETDGFNISPFGSERDGSTLKTFNAKAGITAAPGITLDLSLRNSRRDGDRDGFGGPTGSLATAIDDGSTFTSDVWLAGGRLKWDMIGTGLTHEFRATHNETRTTDADQTFPGFPFNSDNKSEDTKFAYLLSYRFGSNVFTSAKHTLTGMVQKQTEEFTPNTDFADGITRTREQLSTAGEYQGAFADRFFVTGSVRNDDNSSFEDFFTWRTAATLQIPEFALRPHASYGTGVKAPSQFEQFGFIPVFYNPNPNLRPEQSEGWDAGIEFTLLAGKALFDVTYFNQNLTDKIATNPAGPVPTLVNIPGVSTREGVELAARWAVTPTLTLGASYTYLDATNANGLVEIRRPPHEARADVTYLFDNGRGTFNVAAIYNGTMEDQASRLSAGPFGQIFTPERVKLGDYWLVNVAAAYKLQPGIELYGRVENLLDQHYQEVYGFETAGIAAYAGVRFTYEEPSTKDWVKYK